MPQPATAPDGQFVGAGQRGGVAEQGSELIDGGGRLAALDGRRGTSHDRLQRGAQHRLEYTKYPLS